MKGNQVVWFEIYVQDMQRAKTFYEAVFESKLTQLKSEHMPEDMEYYVFPMEDNKYGTAGALVKMDGCEIGTSGTIVYFGCDDCAIESSKAVQNGGKIAHEKFSIGENGFVALINNTEGNMIGLHSMQ
ncbi:MAG: VOC family protein [Sulfurovaceae bacterium]|nr:VOC family protein [Sulfurovaceae bacterium]